MLYIHYTLFSTNTQITHSKTNLLTMLIPSKQKIAVPKNKGSFERSATA